MEVKICTGAKCTLYGASSLYERLSELSENLHDYPNIPEGAELNVEISRCDHSCKERKVSPLVYIDGEAFENAKSSELMELILNRLEEQ